MNRRAAILLACAISAAPVAAHDRSTSYSTWRLAPDGAPCTVGLAAIEATRLPWPLDDATRLGDYLATRLRLFAGDVPCPPAEPPRLLATDPGALAIEWHAVCPGLGPRRIES